MSGDARGRTSARSPEMVQGLRRESSDSDRSYQEAMESYPGARQETSNIRVSARRETSNTRADSQRPSRRFSMLKLLFPFFASFNIKGLNLAYGALMYGYKDIQISSHKTYFTISWIGSLYTAALVLSFPVAKLIMDLLKSSDRTKILPSMGSAPNGKPKALTAVVVTFGVCFRSALLLGIPSLTSSTTLIFLHGLLLGVIDGLLYSISIVTLDQNYYDHPLRWAAIIRIGAGLGGLIYTAILRTCLSTVHFEWGLRIIALCGAGTMLLSLFFLPDIQKEPPTGYSRESARKILIFKDIVGETSTSEVTGNKGPSFTCAIFGLFFTFTSLYYGYHYIVLYGVHATHRTGADSMLLVVEMCACHVVGIVVSNILKRVLRDQLGVLTFAILSMSQTIFTWIGANQNAGLIMFVCFYGFYSAAVDSIHLTCQLSYMHRYEHADTTSRVRYKMLFFFFAMGIGVVLGSASAAVLIDYHSGVFWYSDLLSAGGPFVGSIWFLSAIALLKRRT